jgi:hypothetical protein
MVFLSLLGNPKNGKHCTCNVIVNMINYLTQLPLLVLDKFNGISELAGQSQEWKTSALVT